MTNVQHSVDVENTGSTDPTAVRLRATDPEQRTQALASERFFNWLKLPLAALEGWPRSVYFDPCHANHNVGLSQIAVNAEKDWKPAVMKQQVAGHSLLSNNGN